MIRSATPSPRAGAASRACWRAFLVAALVVAGLLGGPVSAATASTPTGDAAARWGQSQVGVTDSPAGSYSHLHRALGSGWEQ